MWHSSQGAKSEENRGATEVETQTDEVLRCDRSQGAPSGDYFEMQKTLAEWEPATVANVTESGSWQ